MPEQTGEVDVRVKLKGRVKNRFLEIKDALGLTNNTEVMRVAINEFWTTKVAKELKQNE